MRSGIAVLAALSVLPACLGPRVDTSRYFTLPPAGSSAAGVPIASVGLGPVTLPPYLSRPEVATRLGQEQIAYSANDRWAGPLDELTVQALSEERRARLPAREVLHWPWPLGAPPDVTASVEFLRFEADAAGGATIHTFIASPASLGATRNRQGDSEPLGSDLACSVCASQGQLI